MKRCQSSFTCEEKHYEKNIAGGIRIPCQYNNPWTTRFKRQIQDSPCGGGWLPSPWPQYYYYPQYLPWDTAAYYGWSYPQQQQPYPQQWPIDPLQPETSDLYPSYAPQPQQNLYPDQEETSLDWYPPQARPAYEDYYDCGDPCNCYGSCGDYTYTGKKNTIILVFAPSKSQYMRGTTTVKANFSLIHM